MPFGNGLCAPETAEQGLLIEGSSGQPGRAAWTRVMLALPHHQDFGGWNRQCPQLLLAFAEKNEGVKICGGLSLGVYISALSH